MMKSKLPLISLILLSLLLAAGPANAGLRVDGAVFEEDAAPGEHVSHDILVSTKSTDSPLDLKVEIFGYGQALDGSSISLNATQDTSPYSARPFLKSSIDRFHLDPGESKSVTIDGTIPSDASAGGRYAMVNILGSRPSNNSVGINVAINVPVRLTVNGAGLEEAGRIESFALQEPISARGQNVSFIFENTGNQQYRFITEAVVLDKGGRVAANATMDQPARSIPTYSRRVDLKLTPMESLSPGTYNLTTTVKTESGAIIATKETSFDIVA